MKYRVHVYLTVRVPFDVEAESQAEAIKAATKLFDEDQSCFRHNHEADFADEITGYLVDEEGDEEYERTLAYDANGNPSPARKKVERERIGALDDRELATVLAALRHWQQADKFYTNAHDVATCGGTLRQLDDDEIDALCERLNCGG